MQRWVRNNPEVLKQGTLDAIGISGGLFNASVLAVSHDFETLYKASLVMMGVVCRHCEFAWIKSRAVEDGHGAWGWAIMGMAADDLDRKLVQFQQTMVSSTLRGTFERVSVSKKT